MARFSTPIRSATADELPRAISAIVAAFITDPIARFALASPHDYLLHMPRAARLFGGGGIDHGSVYVSDDFRGAAMWLPPGVHPDGEALEGLFRETAEPERLDDLLGTFEHMGRCHPDEPHWYLPLIGVEPHAQCSGIGGELMRHALAVCDREGALAYLESSNPRNISLYERHGFEAMGQIQVGATPLVTPMLRQPRPSR